MVKAEWGVKRECQECGAKFYDLMQTQITCPACDADFDPEAAIRLKRNRQQMADDSVEKSADEAVLLDEDLEADIASDSDDDDLLEDTSAIDTDDDVPVIKPVQDSDSE
ncbi:MAG: FYDLN acid domain-containing protein [Alphaproteobacteria bacterium]